MWFCDFAGQGISIATQRCDTFHFYQNKKALYSDFNYNVINCAALLDMNDDVAR